MNLENLTLEEMLEMIGLTEEMIRNVVLGKAELEYKVKLIPRTVSMSDLPIIPEVAEPETQPNDLVPPDETVDTDEEEITNDGWNNFKEESDDKVNEAIAKKAIDLAESIDWPAEQNNTQSVDDIAKEFELGELATEPEPVDNANKGSEVGINPMNYLIKGNSEVVGETADNTTLDPFASWGKPTKVTMMPKGDTTQKTGQFNWDSVKAGWFTENNNK